jgi:hypothetical protein
MNFFFVITTYYKGNDMGNNGEMNPNPLKPWLPWVGKDSGLLSAKGGLLMGTKKV